MEGKTKSGYVVSRHYFGRSSITRNTNTLYHLMWQWNKEKTYHNVIQITAVQYQKIKKMLLAVKKTNVYTVGDSQGIVYYHNSSSKNYHRIKRYLIKQELIKG